MNGTAAFFVTFNSGGGSDVPGQTIKSGGYATEPAAPTRSGYNFDGWYTDDTFTKVYNWFTAITDHITIYAKWTALPPVLTASDKKLSLNERYTWMDDVDGWEYSGGPVAGGNIIIKRITDEHSGLTIPANAALDTSVKAKYTVTYELTNSALVTTQTSSVIYVGEKDSSGNIYMPWIETTDKALSLGEAYSWMTDVAAYDMDAAPTNITSSTVITQVADLYGAVHNTAEVWIPDHPTNIRCPIR